MANNNENNQPSFICFGAKRFILNSLDDYLDKVYELPEDESNKYFEENPYADILDIVITFCYSVKQKDFYCDVQGQIGNMAGDFCWSPNYALKALRGSNVPECCIPSWLINHQDIQQRYLAGDLSVVPSEPNEKRGYHYKKRETYIQEMQC